MIESSTRKATIDQLVSALKADRRTKEGIQITTAFLERVAQDLEARVGPLQTRSMGIKSREEALDRIQYFNQACFHRIGGLRSAGTRSPGDVHLGVTLYPGQMFWGVRSWGKQDFIRQVESVLRALGVVGPDDQVKTGKGDLWTSAFTGGWFLSVGPFLTADDIGQYSSIEALSGRIVDDLAEQYERLEATAQEIRDAFDEGKEMPEATPPKKENRPVTAKRLCDSLAAHGLSFTPYQVATFVTALQTKGFVILSGISGTGKTKLAQHVAALLGPAGDDTHLFVSVRPDWRDSKPLLGYYNPLTHTYEWTDVLRFLVGQTKKTEKHQLHTLSTWLQAKVDEPVHQTYVREFAEIRNRLVGRSVEDYTLEDLDLIWRKRSNGVADIGQALSFAFDLSAAQLREGTAIARDDTQSPGERLIDLITFLQKLTGVRHWARSLRAIALYDPEHMTTIAKHSTLSEALRILDYSRGFSLPELFARQRGEAIDQAFQFLMERLGELLPRADLLTRSTAAWHIPQYRSTAPVPARDRPAARFLILDEMNLARVEYYFSDLLSVLESGRWHEQDVEAGRCSPEQVGRTKEPIRFQYPDEADGVLPPRELFLPPDLYIAGTVNVDESTHAFSPKVLDRAFTIEFIEADLSRYPASSEEAMTLPRVSLDAFSEAFTRGGEYAVIDKRRVAAFVAGHPAYRNHLATLNDQLRPYDLHFAYRVFDEIMVFLDNGQAAPWFDGFAGLDDAFDSAVLMKVLPKFHGSRGRLLSPLWAVLAWARQPNDPQSAAGETQKQTESAAGCLELRKLLAEQSKGTGGGTGPAYYYPRTAQKVVRMLRQLHETGFASFD